MKSKALKMIEIYGLKLQVRLINCSLFLEGNRLYAESDIKIWFRVLGNLLLLQMCEITKSILAVRRVGNLNNIKTNMFDLQTRVLIGWLVNILNQPIKTRVSKSNIFVSMLR